MCENFGSNTIVCHLLYIRVLLLNTIQYTHTYRAMVGHLSSLLLCEHQQFSIPACIHFNHNEELFQRNWTNLIACVPTGGKTILPGPIVKVSILLLASRFVTVTVGYYTYNFRAINDLVKLNWKHEEVYVICNIFNST